MRKPSFFIVVLAVGIVLTTGVAASLCVQSSSSTYVYDLRTAGPTDAWLLSITKGTYYPTHTTVRRSFGASCVTQCIDSGGKRHAVVAISAGWPIKAFWLEAKYEASLASGGAWFEVAATAFGSGLTIPPSVGTWSLCGRPIQHRIPLVPAWTVLVNVVCVVAMLQLSIHVVVKGRRYLRRRGGRCGDCGYSLLGTIGSDQCPECGALVVVDLTPKPDPESMKVPSDPEI